MTSMAPIRLRIRELRLAQGMTQTELAKRAGLRVASVSAIETGQTSGIDFDTLEKLASVLGCDPGYLIVKGK